MATVAVREAKRSFVGREGELATLTEVSGGEVARVLYLHGVAGIGKSALLGVFLDRLRGTGASVVYLDCRTVEPTERGCLAAAGQVDTVEELVAHLGELPQPVLLVLDHCELFRLMDTWLRRVLVPSLPAGGRLVLAGREPPVAGWFADLGGEFRSLPLGPLGDDDARQLLGVHGARAADAARLNRIARGHPLALILAAAGVAEHPELALEDAATARVIAELTRLYLEDVRDREARRTLEAASVVRRVTEPLLGAMLPEANIDGAITGLLQLPFVDAGREGLVVHEAVREPIDGFLHSTNPVRHRQYRRAAWRQLRNEVNEAAPTELWRYTADMLYLIDNPVVREAFFPSRAQPLAVEPARSADEAAMTAIGRRHEGPEAAALLEQWWSAAPETFSVIRDRDGAITGFFSLLDGTQMRPPLVRDDPVVQAWSRHLREHPLATGQQALGLRRWLAADRGEAPGAVQAACWLDVKRAYMALRPALRRMYVVVHDVTTYWPVVEQLGFRPITEAPVTLDGVGYTSVALDFGPGSVDGWLAGLVADELGVADEPILDEDARELSVQGQRVAMTPLEFALFRHLRQREGRTVSRPELLQEVWGTEFTGGSNVVDAVVRSLRHKLGPAAIVVETIRGSGYRLRPDWRAHLG
jgi:hypothetical protein